MSRLTFPFLCVLLAAGCVRAVKPGEGGVAYRPFRHPGLDEEVRSEGYYVQWPWNKVVRYDVTWRSVSEDVDVLTSEDLHTSTRVTVTFRPDPEALAELHTTIGRDYYAEVIRPNVMTIVRSEFARHGYGALAEESPQIERDVLARLVKELEGKPLQIDRVAIDHIDFDSSLSAAISKKLQMEQTLEQKAYEVEIAARDADIERTRAQGEADATRIVAQGQSEAQALIGESLTPAYLKYKAFDNPDTLYYFVPVGKDGMPIIVDTEGGKRPRATAPREEETSTVDVKTR
ncbi:MAG: prohibitin family protein [Myxococcota bacterium]